MEKIYRYKIALLWLAACAFAIASFYLHVTDNPLGYDEGDYYQAVQRGFWVNWTDADNMPLREFVNTGLGAVRGTKSRAELSRLVRENGSTMFLRHYHPPLAFYPAIVLQPLLQHSSLAVQLRWINLFWILLWNTLICVLFLSIPKAYSPWFLLVPASASFAMSGTGFNMHIPFGLMISLFFLLWYIHETQQPSSGIRRTALFFLAAALCCIEYGVFVLFFLLLWVMLRWWRSPDKLQFTKRQLVNVAWCVLFFLLLWPAGLLSLNLLRSYMFVAYIAIFRLSGQLSAFSSFWEMLFWKWNASPLELALSLGVLVLIMLQWRKVLRQGSLFVSLGLVLATLYLQKNPALVLRWYLFPVFTIIYLLYIPLVVQYVPVIRRIRPDITAGVLGVVFFIIALVTVHNPEDTEMKALLSIVSSHPIREMTIPTSIAPQLTAYHPKRIIHRIHDMEFENPSVRDSIGALADHQLVILPKKNAIEPDSLQTLKTEHYVIYLPQ